MKILYKTGDALAGPEPALAHGCNAQGVMGSGIAKAIREKYPAAWRAYRTFHHLNGLPLGVVIPSNNSPHLVLNCVTQEFYGPGDKVYLDYDALRKAMAGIDRLAKASHSGKPNDAFLKRLDAVAMPLIGAGLAGGDWDRIEAIVEEVSENFQPVVYRLPS